MLLVILAGSPRPGAPSSHLLSDEPQEAFFSRFCRCLEEMCDAEDSRGEATPASLDHLSSYSCDSISFGSIDILYASTPPGQLQHVVLSSCCTGMLGCHAAALIRTGPGKQGSPSIEAPIPALSVISFLRYCAAHLTGFFRSKRYRSCGGCEPSSCRCLESEGLGQEFSASPNDDLLSPATSPLAAYLCGAMGFSHYATPE